MSKVEMNRCNTCSKTVEDYRAEIGWIRISNQCFTFSGKRNEDNEANVLRYIPQLSSASTGLDFCSLKCFVDFLFFRIGLFNTGTSETYSDFLKKQTKEVSDYYMKLEDVRKYIEDIGC